MSLQAVDELTDRRGHDRRRARALGSLSSPMRQALTIMIEDGPLERLAVTDERGRHFKWFSRRRRSVHLITMSGLRARHLAWLDPGVEQRPYPSAVLTEIGTRVARDILRENSEGSP